MKIAIFTNNYLPNPYGVSTSVDGFAQGLRALGHTVYIFAPIWDDQNSEVEVKDDFVFRYRSVAVPTKVPFVLAVPYSHAMDERIEALDLDIIHSQHPNILGSQARRWAKRKNIPLVFTWHSLYDQYVHYVPYIPESIAKKLVMHNAIGYASRADRVIFPTDSIKEKLSKHVEHDRISVVASGVDEKLFENPRGELIRSRHNVPAEVKLIGTISRLTEEKNVIFLSKTIAHFLQDNASVYYLCCGGGNLRQEVEGIFAEAGVSDRVVFTGSLKRGDVKDYLSACDVFVYASTSETQGTIITEAMYCGVPIVAVRASGVKDVVEDGVSGILTLPVPDDFNYALKNVVYDDTFRHMLSHAAKERAFNEFTVSACSEQLLRVYRDTIGQFNEERQG